MTVDTLRDWSLITGKGGGYRTGGGGVKFCPYIKRGGGKSFSHAEWWGEGQNKFWGSFYAVA